MIVRGGGPDANKIGGNAKHSRIYAGVKFLACRLAYVVVKNNAVGAKGLGFHFRQGQIRHRVANATAAMFFQSSVPGAKPRRWTPPLVTHCCVTPWL